MARVCDEGPSQRRVDTVLRFRIKAETVFTPWPHQAPRRLLNTDSFLFDTRVCVRGHLAFLVSFFYFIPGHLGSHGTSWTSGAERPLEADTTDSMAGIVSFSVLCE